MADLGQAPATTSTIVSTPLTIGQTVDADIAALKAKVAAIESAGKTDWAKAVAWVKTQWPHFVTWAGVAYATGLTKLIKF